MGGYAPGGPAGPAGYAGPQWSPQAMQTAPVKEDAFSLGQAFKDWVQILVAPGRFFDSEEGATGFAAPMSQVVAYLLLTSLVSLIGSLVSGNTGGILKMVILLPVSFIMYLVIWLIWAGINHGISRPFGGSGEYSGSFRATVYAAAPFMTLLSLAGLLLTLTLPKPVQTGMIDRPVRVMRAQYSTSRPTPYNQPSFGRPSYGSPGGLNGSPYGSPYGSNPFGNSYGANPFSASPVMPLVILMVLGGMIWSMALMVRGMSATQHMTIGAAAGTVVLSVVLMLVLFVVLSMALGAAIAGAVMAAMH